MRLVDFTKTAAPLFSVVFKMKDDVSVAKIKAAFSRDGWSAGKWAAIGPAAWGVKAYNIEGRSVYYLKGNAYEMGYILGTLATAEVESMCTTYLQRVLPSFLSPELQAKMDLGTLETSMSKIIEHMSDWLVEGCLKMSEVSWPMYTRHMPDFIAEIRGMRDGAVAAGAIGVTFDRLLAINTMPDLLMLKLNGGEMQASFLSFLRLQGYQQAEDTLQRLLEVAKAKSGSGSQARTLDEAMQRSSPLGCNSWAIKDPNGLVSMCRDFQLPNGGVYQDHSCIIIRDGRGAGGCLCFYGGVPSIVGGTTGMKYDGDRYFAIGVNILRSRLQGGCGLPALGIVHKLASHPDIWKTSDAREALQHLPRFAAWTYPVCSESDALALETGASVPLSPSATVRYALSSVDSHLCSAVLSTTLPGDAFQGTEIQNGVASRSFSYEDPDWLSEVNETLFAAFRYRNVIPYSSTDIFDPSNYSSDVELRQRGIRLGNYYFVPSRSNKNLLVTSNDAIVPLMRLFQMNTAANDAADMTSRSVQWRYDRAVKFGSKLLGRKNPSRKNLESVVSFLSPEHFMAPGDTQYWKSADSSDPLSATIEGNLNIVRAGRRGRSSPHQPGLPECAFGHKAGKFTNAFTWVTCQFFI